MYKITRFLLNLLIAALCLVLLALLAFMLLVAVAYFKEV